MWHSPWNWGRWTNPAPAVLVPRTARLGTIGPGLRVARFQENQCCGGSSASLSHPAEGGRLALPAAAGGRRHATHAATPRHAAMLLGSCWGLGGPDIISLDDSPPCT